MSKEYSDLYKISDASVFQSPLWLTHMYRDLVPKMDADPVIVTVYKETSDELILVMPLVRTRYGGLPCIEPVDFGVADYNKLVASPILEPNFYSDPDIQAFLRDQLKPFHLIFFRKVLNECPWLTGILSNPVVMEMETSFYDTPVWGPYESWRDENLSKSFKKELRRKRKKLEEFGDVEFEILTDKQPIREAMKLLQIQRGRRFEDDLLLQDKYFDFYSNIAVEGAKTGLTQTAILKAGGEIAAVEFGLADQGTYHFILGGFNEDYSRAAPGILMIEHVLQQRIALGDSRADFTIGDEAYKAKFNTQPRPLKHVAVAGTLVGQLAHLAYHKGGVLKKAVKAIANMRIAS